MISSPQGMLHHNSLAIGRSLRSAACGVFCYLCIIAYARGGNAVAVVSERLPEPAVKPDALEIPSPPEYEARYF